MKKLKSQVTTERLAFKIDETAQCLGVSPASVRRLIARGDLVPIRHLRHVLVTAESVQALVQPN
jgi:hypothetical protein